MQSKDVGSALESRHVFLMSYDCDLETSLCISRSFQESSLEQDLTFGAISCWNVLLSCIFHFSRSMAGLGLCFALPASCRSNEKNMRSRGASKHKYNIHYDINAQRLHFIFLSASRKTGLLLELESLLCAATAHDLQDVQETRRRFAKEEALDCSFKT